MILTILSVLLSAVGAFLVVLGFDRDKPAIAILCLVLSVCCITSFAIGTGSGIHNIANYEVEHGIAIQEREAIVYRLEKQESELRNEYTVNGGVYQDAIEFNKKVKMNKKWGTNPFTNWYSGWAYADLEEIEIVKGN